MIMITFWIFQRKSAPFRTKYSRQNYRLHETQTINLNQRLAYTILKGSAKIHCKYSFESMISKNFLRRIRNLKRCSQERLQRKTGKYLFLCSPFCRDDCNFAHFFPAWHNHFNEFLDKLKKKLFTLLHWRAFWILLRHERNYAYCMYVRIVYEQNLFIQ